MPRKQKNRESPLAYHRSDPQLLKLRLESGSYTAVQLHVPINIRVRLEREANPKNPHILNDVYNQLAIHG